MYVSDDGNIRMLDDDVDTLGYLVSHDLRMMASYLLIICYFFIISTPP